MKFMAILIKYKYALIALALVAVIAGASVLYNSLSDEYRGDGFAEVNGGVLSSGGDKTSGESGESGGGSETPPPDEEGSSPESGENDGGSEAPPSDEEGSSPESGESDGGSETPSPDEEGSAPESDSDADHDHGNGSESRYSSVYDFNFTAIDKDGKEVKLSDYVGKPIVLNFWATWCPHCVVEMHEFERASKDLPGVTFLMLNATGRKGETVYGAKSYIEENGFEFPVLYDVYGEAVNSFGISSFPMTFLIDENGYIRLYIRGRTNYNTLLSALGEIGVTK